MFKTAIRSMSSSTSASVLLEKINNTGIITLNRPKALNSLTLPMIRSIYPQLKEWNGSVNSVIIDSCIPKAFCAGGDVVDVTVKNKESPTQTDFFKEEYRLNHLIGTLKTPYIALIDGITMGGGVGLSVHGRYRVATERTLFAMPETMIGLFPDVGGSWFLPRLKGQLGMYLALTGYRLKGSDVFHAGIATHMCNSSSIPNLKTELIENSNPERIPEILDSYSRKFQLDDFTIREDQLRKMDDYFRESKTDFIEIFKMLENSSDEFAAQIFKTLRQMSPTSLLITFRQLREGKRLQNLAECLKMEYRIVRECCKRNDFYEGVRSLLVDKDNNPKWDPSTLEKVSDIQAFFKESKEDELDI